MPRGNNTPAPAQTMSEWKCHRCGRTNAWDSTLRCANPACRHTYCERHCTVKEYEVLYQWTCGGCGHANSWVTTRQCVHTPCYHAYCEMDCTVQSYYIPLEQGQRQAGAAAASSRRRA